MSRKAAGSVYSACARLRSLRGPGAMPLDPFRIFPQISTALFTTAQASGLSVLQSNRDGSRDQLLTAIHIFVNAGTVWDRRYFPSGGGSSVSSCLPGPAADGWCRAMSQNNHHHPTEERTGSGSPQDMGDNEPLVIQDIKCYVCDKVFTRLDHLRRHERAHSAEKPFGCAECKRRFSRL